MGFPPKPAHCSEYPKACRIAYLPPAAIVGAASLAIERSTPWRLIRTSGSILRLAEEQVGRARIRHTMRRSPSVLPRPEISEPHSPAIAT
jgi:hypothetical protein